MADLHTCEHWSKDARRRNYKSWRDFAIHLISIDASNHEGEEDEELDEKEEEQEIISLSEYELTTTKGNYLKLDNETIMASDGDYFEDNIYLNQFARTPFSLREHPTMPLLSLSNNQYKNHHYPGVLPSTLSSAAESVLLNAGVKNH